jgi:hypothetical protein
MNRRGFLSAMLTACAAPAIVRADSLMRIVPLIESAPTNWIAWDFARSADICTVTTQTWFTRDTSTYFLDQNGILRKI